MRHFCIRNAVKSLIVEKRLRASSAEHNECTVYVLLSQVYLLVEYEFFESFLRHSFWLLAHSFEKLLLLRISKSLRKFTDSLNFLVVRVYDRSLLEICHEANGHVKRIDFLGEINFQSCDFRCIVVSLFNDEPSEKDWFILGKTELLLKDFRQLVYLNGAIRLVITLENLVFYLIERHPFDLQKGSESLESFLDGRVL